MKQRFVLKISKATVKAWVASFATLIAVGLIALVIVWSIPSTPFAQIHHLADISSNNPAIFNTGIYQDNAPLANLWDGVVITGISFFLSGVPFGWITGRRGQMLSHILGNAAACAFFLSAVIVGMGWLGLVALSRSSYLDNGMIPPVLMPKADYWLTGGAQAAFWTVAFLAGTFLATRLPRRAAGAAPKQAPTA